MNVHQVLAVPGEVISSHPILITLSLVVLYPVVRTAHNSYRAWLALGPGGVPYNLLGWTIQSVLGALISNPTLSLANPAAFSDPDLEKHYAGHTVPSGTSFLDAPLPLRAGPTPLVPGTVAPQRQITQQTHDAALLADMSRYLRLLAEANSHLGLVMQAARLEGGSTQAIYLPARPKGSTGQQGRVPSTPRFLAKVHGEICHVHSDGSSHITLSLADAAEAVAKGWAQRHKLSGASWGVIPPTYLFVYAPRSREDFAVWRALMSAGVAFVCGRKVEHPAGV